MAIQTSFSFVMYWFYFLFKSIKCSSFVVLWYTWFCDDGHSQLLINIRHARPIKSVKCVYSRVFECNMSLSGVTRQWTDKYSSTTDLSITAITTPTHAANI